MRTCPGCRKVKEWQHLYCRNCWFALPTLLRSRLAVKTSTPDSRVAYLEATRFLRSIA